MENENSCPGCSDSEGNGERLSHHSEKTVGELVRRLNRIEGQIRGIRGMVQRSVYCDDVLNQISSAQSALNGVAKLLLEKHLKSCVAQRLRSGDDEVVDEVVKAIFKLTK